MLTRKRYDSLEYTARSFAGTSALPPDLLKPRYWPTWLTMALARRLARQPHARLLKFGKLLGALSYMTCVWRRLRAERHIRMCFPQMSTAERRKLVYRNFLAYGMGAFERLMGWWWPAARLLELLDSVEGLEHLYRASAQGRGVILLTLHTTTMELGGALIRQFHPVDCTYQAARNPVYEWFQLQARRRADRPGQTIEASNIRSVLRRLKAGGVLWYAADRDYGNKPHVFAPFFGIPAATITATSKYARLSGAQVLTLSYWRDAAGRYRLRIGAALADFPGEDPAADCARINAWAESEIARYPEQYRWVHKRFRTRPRTLSGSAPCA